MLSFLGKGENQPELVKIGDDLCLGSVCPFRFVPLSAPWERIHRSVMLACGDSGGWSMSWAAAWSRCWGHSGDKEHPSPQPPPSNVRFWRDFLEVWGGSAANFLEVCFEKIPYGNFHTKETSKKSGPPSGSFRPNPPPPNFRDVPAGAFPIGRLVGKLSYIYFLKHIEDLMSRHCQGSSTQHKIVFLLHPSVIACARRLKKMQDFQCASNERN